MKDKVAAMFNKSPGTMSPAALQKAKEDSKANRYFDRAFGYDDSASAGSAKGDTAYYAQRFWPGSTEVHDAIVNSKKFWPDDSYFAGHNHRPT